MNLDQYNDHVRLAERLLTVFNSVNEWEQRNKPQVEVHVSLPESTDNFKLNLEGYASLYDTISHFVFGHRVRFEFNDLFVQDEKTNHFALKPNLISQTNTRLAQENLKKPFISENDIVMTTDVFWQLHFPAQDIILGSVFNHNDSNFEKYSEIWNRIQTARSELWYPLQEQVIARYPLSQIVWKKAEHDLLWLWYTLSGEWNPFGTLHFFPSLNRALYHASNDVTYEISSAFLQIIPTTLNSERKIEIQANIQGDLVDDLFWVISEFPKADLVPTFSTKEDAKQNIQTQSEPALLFYFTTETTPKLSMRYQIQRSQSAKEQFYNFHFDPTDPAESGENKLNLDCSDEDLACYTELTWHFVVSKRVLDPFQSALNNSASAFYDLVKTLHQNSDMIHIEQVASILGCILLSPGLDKQTEPLLFGVIKTEKKT